MTCSEWLVGRISIGNDGVYTVCIYVCIHTYIHTIYIYSMVINNNSSSPNGL